MTRILAVLLSLGLLLAPSVDARSRQMAEAAEQDPQPAADGALVVFLRSSFYGAAIQATVYEAQADGERFLGIASNKTRIATRVAPGAHRFMVVGESADFLDANLEAGKTYYALVTPRMGAWKVRFSLLPVRTDAAAEHDVHSKDFAKWIRKTTLVEIAPEAEAWYAEHRASVTKKRARYEPEWDGNPRPTRRR